LRPAAITWHEFAKRYFGDRDHICQVPTRIMDNDLTWTTLRETGITTVFHLPCLPAAIEEAQLPLAKPSGAGEAYES
jgi:hypothetical protein